MLPRHLWITVSALVACTPANPPPHDEAREGEVLFAAYSPPPLSPQVPRIPTPADPRLPDVPTQALGFWRGDFSVTPDGASSYRLELDFARGRAGIEPSIAVRYGSDLTDGPLGVGWSLAGVSKIHRCAKKHSIDLVSRPVQFLSDDALCLDGARLLEVPTPERTTTRGDIELRLEHDVGIRVLAFTNGVPRTPVNDRWDVLRFELAQPSGTLSSFGGDAGSMMVGPGGRTRVWAERTRYDLFGNTMTFTWAKPRKARHASLGVEDREQLLDPTPPLQRSPHLARFSSSTSPGGVLRTATPEAAPTTTRSSSPSSSARSTGRSSVDTSSSTPRPQSRPARV